jgi:hypothetical protein
MKEEGGRRSKTEIRGRNSEGRSRRMKAGRLFVTTARLRRGFSW